MKLLPIINHPMCDNFCVEKMRVRNGRYGRFFYCPVCSATKDVLGSHIKWPKGKEGHARVWTGSVLTYSVGEYP